MTGLFGFCTCPYSFLSILGKRDGLKDRAFEISVLDRRSWFYDLLDGSKGTEKKDVNFLKRILIDRGGHMRVEKPIMDKHLTMLKNGIEMAIQGKCDFRVLRYFDIFIFQIGFEDKADEVKFIELHDLTLDYGEAIKAKATALHFMYSPSEQSLCLCLIPRINAKCLYDRLARTLNKNSAFDILLSSEHWTSFDIASLDHLKLDEKHIVEIKRSFDENNFTEF